MAPHSLRHCFAAPGTEASYSKHFLGTTCMKLGLCPASPAVLACFVLARTIDNHSPIPFVANTTNRPGFKKACPGNRVCTCRFSETRHLSIPLVSKLAHTCRQLPNIVPHKIIGRLCTLKASHTKAFFFLAF